MVDRTVAFETKVWEQDYRQVLTQQRIGAAVGRNQYSFSRRTVYVNNVDRPGDAMRRAERLVSADLLDDVVLVEDHAAAALRHFKLTRDDLGRGYVYSISELVGLYLARTDYLLHFAGDTVLAGPLKWLPSAMALMERRQDVAVTNVSWSSDMEQPRGEASDTDGDFLLGYGFSDQMYLVRTDDFRQTIFGESHVASGRYPAYGGELFEKRVDAWMRNHRRLRATWVGGHYVHENVRRSPSAFTRIRARLARRVS